MHLPSIRGGAAPSKWKRDYCLKQVLLDADTCLEPTIICGDFNDNVHAEFLKHLPKGWTINLPFLRVLKSEGVINTRGDGKL